MIREISLNDIQTIHDLNTAELNGTSSVEALTHTLTRILELPDQHYIIGYELENKLVGYVHAQRFEMLYNPNTLLNVVSLVVDGNYQGKKIGSILMDSIEELAREIGVDGIRINSGNNRERAHQFYEKRGYVSNRNQKRYVKIFD